MVDFIQRLNRKFTDADKETNLPLIDRIVEMATIARSKGLLALEKSALEAENYFMKIATMLIVDANDPDKVKEMLQMYIISEDLSGAELLGRLLITQGVMMIASGRHPRLVRETLNMMLGEKYLLRMLKVQEEEAKKTNPVQQFLKSVEDRKQCLKFRDRCCYLSEKHVSLRLKCDKTTLYSYIDDFNISETLDFFLYKMDSMSVQRIIKEVENKDLVTVFKSRDCDRATYSALLDNLTESGRHRLIADVNAASEVEPADADETKKRIIETIKKLEDDMSINFGF